MSYSETTRHHFEDPARAGTLTGERVQRGAAGSRSQGTWVQFDIRTEGAKVPHVVEVRFLVYGCPHVIAIADWLAAQAVGRVAEAALPESVHALAARFDVPTTKLGRLLVIEDAWIAAISSPYRT